MSKRRVRANGIEMSCVIEGEGPWLVLSHSLACDHTMWDDQMAALTASFKVLNYETRGHGRTDATPGPYSLDLLADDLIALLDALGIAKAHFVGLSMGGMIGQVCALKHQDRFERLVLCDTTSFYDPSVRPIWMQRIRQAETAGVSSIADSTLERWFTPEFRARRPDVMDKFGACIAATSLDGYAACSEALLDINVTAELKNICRPMRIIVGACDVGTPVAMARAIHESVPGSDLVVVEQAAHFPNVEQTQTFNRALVSFLRGETDAR